MIMVLIHGLISNLKVKYDRQGVKEDTLVIRSLNLMIFSLKIELRREVRERERVKRIKMRLKQL